MVRLERKIAFGSVAALLLLGLAEGAMGQQRDLATPTSAPAVSSIERKGCTDSSAQLSSATCSCRNCSKVGTARSSAARSIDGDGPIDRITKDKAGDIRVKKPPPPKKP